MKNNLVIISRIGHGLRMWTGTQFGIFGSILYSEFHYLRLRDLFKIAYVSLAATGLRSYYREALLLSIGSFGSSFGVMICRRRFRRRGCPLANDNMHWLQAGTPQSGPLSDLECMLEETKLELAAGLKIGIARAENIEMNSEIWCSLPEELLMLILANLSTLISGRFRAVCKQWKHLLSPEKALIQSFSTIVPICSSSAFLFGCFRPSCLTKYLLEDWYLLQSESTCSMYKFSLDFLEQGRVNVLTACKSLLCCSKNRTSASFCICNAVTRTWIILPPPTQLKRWDFIGLAFKTSTRVCTLVIGTNQGNNNMVMEIYDSGTNRWAKLEITNPPISVCPAGEGVYSRGKFYWINKSSVGEVRWEFRFDVVAFNVAERSWDVIGQPQREGPTLDCFLDWELSGCDGNVVLVYNKELSLWKLIEDEDEGKIKCRWSEFQPIPRSVCQEALHGRNINNDFNGPIISRRIVKRCNYPQVVVNSCGWLSVYLPGNKLVFFDAERRMMNSIDGRLLTVLEQSYLIPLHGYELNNIWWPS